VLPQGNILKATVIQLFSFHC